MVSFDLNVPIISPVPLQLPSKKDKGKGKQQQQASAPQRAIQYSAAQLNAIETRVDVLVHLGYTVIAFTQTVAKKLDPKIHLNYLDPLIEALKKRNGVVFLKRLNIVLDEDSEKGFGLASAATSFLSTYDIISLVPHTAATLSLACLSHTVPSSITAHIISIPLSLPRLPYHLKHTLIRTARKNGAVFEINYGLALGAGAEEWEGPDMSGSGDKKNWWVNARDIVRVTKGKGIIFSSGVLKETGLRAPKDIENLATFLGLAPDAAHEAISNTPTSLIIRAQTRKTYRAVLSEPTLIIPPSHQPPPGQDNGPSQGMDAEPQLPPSETSASPSAHKPAITPDSGGNGNSRKRPRGDTLGSTAGESHIKLTDPVITVDPASTSSQDASVKRKKKKRKGNDNGPQ